MGRLVALAAVLVAAGAFASVAAGAAPTVIPYSVTATVPLTGACSFEISVTAVATGTETLFFNSSGALVRQSTHQVEQDTFTANGVTLSGEPYVTNAELLFDSSGNITHNYESGQSERVILPDGTAFFTAGHTDSAVYPPGNPESFFIQPQVGNQGDIAAFCAALS